MAQTFDAASNRTQLAASIGSTADFVDDFSFDNLLRMTRIERQGAGGGNTVAEIRVDLAYNALGQFATIDRYADLAGTKLAVSTAYGYDGANRLASLYHTQSTNDLAKYDFSWDNADRLTSIDSMQDGVTNFTYDVTNQLTGADFATQSDETHAWTANGNPTGGGYTVTANNRVSTDGTYNYTYDNEGNRTRKTKISDGSYTDYVWDHRNRLMSVISKTSGGVITQQVDYVYDFLNQLITRTIDADGAGGGSATSQWFAYSDGQIVLSFDSSSATTPDHRYLWGPEVDQLFADENSTNDILYPLGDQVGTLRDIAQYDDGTDTTSVVNHVIFSSFNAQLSSSNSAYDILFGQTGRLHDSATGLDNHLHRWLDSWLKRWISEDPSGFDGGDVNLKRYIGNAVLMNIDPTGLRRRIMGFLGHTWLEVETYDKNGKVTGMVELHFGPAGYTICPKGDSYPALQPGLWNLSNKKQDELLIELWNELEEERQAGNIPSYSLNPFKPNICWVPSLLFVYFPDVDQFDTSVPNQGLNDYYGPGGP